MLTGLFAFSTTTKKTIADEIFYKKVEFFVSGLAFLTNNF